MFKVGDKVIMLAKGSTKDCSDIIDDEGKLHEIVEITNRYSRNETIYYLACTHRGNSKISRHCVTIEALIPVRQINIINFFLD